MTTQENKSGNVLIISYIFFALIMGIDNSKGSTPGIFDRNTDVGNSALQGSVKYNQEKQEYTLKGSGENIWFDKDEFHFLWKSIGGDFIMRARVRFVGDGVHEHRKIGLMIRDCLTTNSAHVSAVVHGDGLTALQYRKTAGNTTEESKAKSSYPCTIQIERTGDTFIMSVPPLVSHLKLLKLTELSLMIQYLPDYSFVLIIQK